MINQIKVNSEFDKRYKYFIDDYNNSNFGFKECLNLYLEIDRITIKYGDNVNSDILREMYEYKDKLFKQLIDFNNIRKRQNEILNLLEDNLPENDHLRMIIVEKRYNEI